MGTFVNAQKYNHGIRVCVLPAVRVRAQVSRTCCAIVSLPCAYRLSESLSIRYVSSISPSAHTRTRSVQIQKFLFECTSCPTDRVWACVHMLFYLLARRCRRF